jgi:hypothetical protein
MEESDPAQTDIIIARASGEGRIPRDGAGEPALSEVPAGPIPDDIDDEYR